MHTEKVISLLNYPEFEKKSSNRKEMLLENLGGLATGFSLTSLISVGGKSIYVPIATQVRFRRRTLKSPQFSTPEFAKIYRELRKEDRFVSDI